MQVDHVIRLRIVVLIAVPQVVRALLGVIPVLAPIVFLIPTVHLVKSVATACVFCPVSAEEVAVRALGQELIVR